MKRFNIFTLDVWGNEAEGFEVNDRFRAGSIDVSDEATDAEIWLALVDDGPAFGPFERARFEDVSGDGHFIVISDKENGMPVFHLEREES